MKYLRIFLAVSLLPAVFGMPFDAAAQSCRETILPTTPDTAFILHDDGTATHTTTGLIWMRCSLGQHWNGSGCDGAAADFTWAEALQAAAGHEFAGSADWRLPNKNELESIVEESCFTPAINATVFPGTAFVFFWSSSPYAGLGLGAWSVDFGYGTVSATVKTGKLPVRLVRDDVW